MDPEVIFIFKNDQKIFYDKQINRLRPFIFNQEKLHDKKKKI